VPASSTQWRVAQRGRYASPECMLMSYEARVVRSKRKRIAKSDV
jgi:hypothetical protein